VTVVPTPIDVARLSIRRVAPADLDAMFGLQTDPVAAAMAMSPVRDRSAFDAHWAMVLATPTAVTFVIEYDGTIVGDIGSWLADGQREIGYRIARDWWGRGLATAAVARLLAELPERPLFARTIEGNGGSQRVLERSGFVMTGSETAPDGVREWHYRLDR